MDTTAALWLSGKGFLPETDRPMDELFEHIFNEHYKPVYNYMRYRVDNACEAEELCSLVFEKVTLNISRYDAERAPFEVWLFSIAQNVFRDYCRRQKRWLMMPLDNAHELPSPLPTPEAAALVNDEHSRLLDALRQLGERERSLVALKFAGGLTNRDIARMTGLSESNVGVILYRSIRQLRNTLGQEEGK